MDLTCARKYDYYLFDLTKNRAKACCKSPFSTTSSSFQNDLQNILQDRVALKNGQKVESCSNCWKLESGGYKSFRSSIPFSSKSVSSNDEHFPHLVEFLVGNLCNLRCIYCGPESSSRWQSGKITFDAIKTAIPQDIVNFIENKWGHIGMFNLVGGEPTLISMSDDILNLLLSISQREQSVKRKRIRVISNLSAPTSVFQKFINKLAWLSEYFDIEVGVSAESLGQRFEYIRDGANFDLFQNNLKTLLQQKGLDVTLQSTLNILAIPKFHEFLATFVDQLRSAKKSIHLNFNEVVWPEELSPRNYPRILSAEKAQALEVLSEIPNNEKRNAERFVNFSESLSQLYDSLGTGSMAATIKFLNCSEPNRLKKMNWRKVFPEVAIIEK